MHADADAPLFRELRGDYVDGAGQVTTLREYLDYFEPLGTALSRLPDGAGGPFLYQFSGSGGRVIGAMGWVVSASAKRFGAWKLWGIWAERPIPLLALPLLWTELPDSERLPDLIDRANANADPLLRRDVFDDINATRLHDGRFRALLKAHLARAYRAPDARDRPIEVEVSAGTLDLLPWLYLLGPVDPEIAQLQPNRFNGVGYQYILTNASPPGADEDVPPEIESMVDTTASDVLEGWRMATALRERRSRPTRAVEPRARHRPSPEISEMRKPPAPPSKHPAPQPDLIWRVARDAVIIALLAWIAFNVNEIRKSVQAPAQTSSAAVTMAAPEAEAEPEPPPPTRAQRIANALSASPPRGMQIAPAVLESIRGDGPESTAALERAAIEIFLRRNACFARAEVVDGKFSTAEQRAIRNCQILTRERLMTSDTKPHPERAVAWLEKTVVP